jgi:AAA15 family ATPase/GTPase
MPKRPVCRNYLSLEDFEPELTPMTVLVGSNGSGKSTVLSPIDLVLREPVNIDLLFTASVPSG